MKTLRYLIGAASIAMVASFAGGAASAATVVGTPHDLTGLTTSAATAQVCVFCHTPHNGAQGGGGNYDGIPLWNRQADANTVNPGSFQVYSSSTLDATPGQPSGVSLGCLSCHDGVTAFDSLIVTSEATALTTPGATMSSAFPGSPAILGGDLRNDHPISITYGLPAADFKATTLPLFGAGGDQVECGSCHNPHDNDQVAANASKFLRMSNASSALCLNCHVK